MKWVLLAAALAILPSPVGAQLYPPVERPYGFGRATTGGCATLDPSCQCVVTSLADSGPGTLRSCLEVDAPKWVTFQVRGTIHINRRLLVGPDKTIDGRGDGPVSLVTALNIPILHLSNPNVIVMGLRFPTTPEEPVKCLAQAYGGSDDDGCPSPIEVSGNGRNIWITHNEFDNCGNKCIVVWAWPGAPGVKAIGGDLVTISSNWLHNTQLTMVAGSHFTIPRELVPDQMRVSMYWNYIEHDLRRSPRATLFAKIHFWNNYVKDWGAGPCSGYARGFASSAIGEGQLLAEGNVYEPLPGPVACKSAAETGIYDATHGQGCLRASGNLLRNDATVQENCPASVFDPTNQATPDYYHPYPLVPATDALASWIRQQVGIR